MSVTIRKANAEDQSACATLLAQLNEATGADQAIDLGTAFDSMIDDTRGMILLAIEDDHILGMASCSFNLALRYGGEYCQLEELIVTPEARGKNVGALLMQACVSQATQRGCADFGLYLVPTTEHNRGFYERFGFTALGTEMRQTLNG